MVKNLQTTQHKTNQKTHTNQLISDKFLQFTCEQWLIHKWKSMVPGKKKEVALGHSSPLFAVIGYGKPTSSNFKWISRIFLISYRTTELQIVRMKSDQVLLSKLTTHTEPRAGVPLTERVHDYTTLKGTVRFCHSGNMLPNVLCFAKKG